jgi:hypothetical protein
MMNKILQKKERQALEIAKLLNYQTLYIPSLIEERTLYKAFVPDTEISAFGQSEEESIENAIKFATAIFMSDSNELLRAKKALTK